MNYTRFSLYAPLLPGRRYSYDLDQDLDSDLDGERRGQEEGREGLDGAADHYFGHDGYDRSLLPPLFPHLPTSLHATPSRVSVRLSLTPRARHAHAGTRRTLSTWSRSEGLGSRAQGVRVAVERLRFNLVVQVRNLVVQVCNPVVHLRSR